MGIKADAQEYEVKLTTEPIGGEDGPRSFLGSSDEATNIIVIDGTMPESRQEEVLLHELCHIADPTMPEFAVKQMSIGLYGILRSNGLLVKDLIGKVKTGEISAEEMKALNKESEEMAEQMGMLRTVARPDMELPGRERYDEAQWKAACLLPDLLPYRHPNGSPSLPAMRLAAAQLIGVRPGPTLSIEQKRAAARQLVWAYKGLKVEPPAALAFF